MRDNGVTIGTIGGQMEENMGAPKLDELVSTGFEPVSRKM